MTLEENLEIAALKNNHRFNIINNGELRYEVISTISKIFSEEYSSIAANQPITDSVLIKKKAILCRCLLQHPSLLIYDNPFSRMDISDRLLFYKDIIKVHQEGVAQIIISAYQEELNDICLHQFNLSKGYCHNSNNILSV